MIIYVHGYGGSGEGHKATLFRKYYKNEHFIAPSLSYVPTLAIKTLEEIILTCKDMDEEVKLIGSSMGGFMSIYLANKYKLKAVIINPSIYPWKTLKRTIGFAPNFYDESTFEWNEKHLEMLYMYKTELKKSNDILVLLQKGDDLLDYREAVEYFEDKIPSKNLIVEEGGSHSFENIESKFKIIDTHLFS